MLNLYLNEFRKLKHSVCENTDALALLSTYLRLNFEMLILSIGTYVDYVNFAGFESYSTKAL